MSWLVNLWNRIKLFFAPKVIPVAIAPPAPVVALEPPVDTTPWMTWMRSHIGEPMVTGKKTTAFDEMVFSHTNLNIRGVMDEGCAACVCAALELTGYKSTHNSMAISYQHYGEPCELKPGCITVFTWSGGSHHVSFCNRIIDENYAEFLGGNQGGSLKLSTYDRKFITATRWPVKTA